MAELTATRWQPLDGGKPRGLVVLCHGLGALGSHWAGFVTAVRPLLPHVLFAAPDGPEAMAGGGPGRRWWDYHNRSAGFAEAGVQAAAAAFDRFLAAERRAHDLPATRCALAGFSQGAMTVLHAAPRHAEAPAAVLSIAGRLLAPERLAGEIACRPPVLLIHGADDINVRPEESSRAAEHLRQAGVEAAALLLDGLAHAIDARASATGGAFLRARLAPA